MSANRDKNQRVTFVYSNLYEIYRKNQEPVEIKGSGAVLKAGDRHAVQNYQPLSLLATKPIPKIETQSTQLHAASARQAQAQAVQAQDAAIQGLKDNLKTLDDLHSRLRFMLKELEELVSEE